MLNETFYLDGIDARSVGIQLQAPIEFSEAVPVVEAQTVPGRNGDLIWETGSYENRSASASCFCLQKDVEKAVSSAGRFLMGKKGYRRLETNDDPEHFWLARVENSPQISIKARMLAPFDIDFDCKPQRFLKIGEEPIVFEKRAAVNYYKIFNEYGQTALPLITLYGTGTQAIITIGDCRIKVNEFEHSLILDSDTQNAYNGSGNQNMVIETAKFPVLNTGETQIVWSGGIDRIEIVPRWWEL